jgi:tetratricopeptide (TPR) repeat protein
VSNDAQDSLPTGALPRGDKRPPFWQLQSPWLSRQPVLLVVLIAIGAALYAATYFVTRAFHSREQQLAESWYERGTRELNSGHAENAITDFRSALLYSPADARYHMSLAQALMATGRYEQAGAYFQSLLELEPGDGFINLQLARLAVLRRDLADAQRFFHGAIYGIWDRDPDANRRQARLELIDFLLKENRPTQAESELVAIISTLPRDRALLLRVAGLFAAVGDFDHAARTFSEVLRLDPRDPDALLGLGQAEFAMGRYAAAQQHLQSASQRDPGNQPVAQLARIAGLVVQLDPYTRMSAAERRKRVLRDFDVAGQRLQQCASSQVPSLPPALSSPKSQPQQPAPQAQTSIASLGTQWSALRTKLNDRAMRSDPDLVDQAIDLIFATERATEKSCGEPSEADRALLLIARHERS